MPIVSVFLGIIIRILYGDPHDKPCIYAEYDGENTIFDIDGNILKGEMPQKQKILVLAWLELHRDEVKANCSLSKNGEKIREIPPITIQL